MFIGGLLILIFVGAIYVHKEITEQIYENPSKAKRIFIGLAIAAVIFLGFMQINELDKEFREFNYELGYQDGKSDGYSEGYREGQQDPYFGQ